MKYLTVSQLQQSLKESFPDKKGLTKRNLIYLVVDGTIKAKKDELTGHYRIEKREAARYKRLLERRNTYTKALADHLGVEFKDTEAVPSKRVVVKKKQSRKD